MFKNRALGAKIISGFLAVIALVIGAGVAGYFGVVTVGNALHRVANEEAPIIDASMEMKMAVGEGKMLGDELKSATAVMATYDGSQIDGIVKHFEKTMARFDTFAAGILHGGEVEGQAIIETDNAELASLVRQAEELHDKSFQPAFNNLKETGRGLIEAKAARDKAMEAVEAEYGKLVPITENFEKMVRAEVDKKTAAADTAEKAKQIMTEEVPLADCAMEIKFAIAQSRLVLEEIAQADSEEQITSQVLKFDQTIKTFDEFAAAVREGGEIDGEKIVATNNEKIRQAAEQADKLHGNFQAAAQTLIAKQLHMVAQTKLANESVVKLDEAGESMDSLLAKVEQLSGQEMAEAKRDAMTARTSAIWLDIIIASGSVAFGLAISLFLTRSITKPLNRVIEGLTVGAQQVAAASEQVSQSSQQMAEGSSEQASSLEETSSSLEEMSSMTRQNAENARQASERSNEARGAAEKSRDAMARMSGAITKIKTTSDETAKIVKTIDEIAFQTNLLALNAAVEAARAGDAGKGFAVVAEEVRNLAQRSAEAAKNTAALIEGAQRNADNGVSVSNEVEAILNEIVSGVQKVTHLIGDVSSASDQQAQGIDQINTAVAQMDKVVQSNAANSEESAAASEELSSQAIELMDMVNVLVRIARGGSAVVGDQGFAGGKQTASRQTMREGLHQSQSLFHRDRKNESARSVIANSTHGEKSSSEHKAIHEF